MKHNTPDYKKIYSDLINLKYPDKKEICDTILKKKELSYLDVIEINTILFASETREESMSNQKLRTYDKSSILEILKYQKQYNLNNSQLSRHFKLSRNTVSKWKKMFLS